MHPGVIGIYNHVKGLRKFWFILFSAYYVCIILFYPIYVLDDSTEFVYICVSSKL